MNLQDAAAVARRQIADLFDAYTPRDIRLEGFLYDDHLMVWSLTIGFALSSHVPQAADPAGEPRRRKIVRVSEADKSVLSVNDP